MSFACRIKHGSLGKIKPNSQAKDENEDQKFHYYINLDQVRHYL